MGGEARLFTLLLETQERRSGFARGGLSGASWRCPGHRWRRVSLGELAGGRSRVSTGSAGRGFSMDTFSGQPSLGWGPLSAPAPHCCQQLSFSVPPHGPMWPAGPSQQHKPHDLLLPGVGVAEKGQHQEARLDLSPQVSWTISGGFSRDMSLLGPVPPSASSFCPSPPCSLFSPGQPQIFPIL